MFRFKLRTLLIATALVGLFLLGLQVHVHNKAKRFVEEMKAMSGKAEKRLITDARIDSESSVISVAATLKPTTLTDFGLIRRRAEVYFVANTPDMADPDHYNHYSFSVFGDRLEFSAGWRSVDETN